MRVLEVQSSALYVDQYLKKHRKHSAKYVKLVSYAG